MVYGSNNNSDKNKSHKPVNLVKDIILIVFHMVSSDISTLFGTKNLTENRGFSKWTVIVPR
jgi:hypothetical protein